MLIESKIKRANGTVITLQGEVYHFQPKVVGGPHIADVKNPEHVDRLLAIPEGYRAVMEGRKDADQTDAKAAEPKKSGRRGNAAQAPADTQPQGEGEGEAQNQADQTDAKAAGDQSEGE